MIKYNHKIRWKTLPFRGRRWADAIDCCIGKPGATWNWQCGINESYEPNTPKYYMWFWNDSALHQRWIPEDLNDYIAEICKKRNFVP